MLFGFFVRHFSNFCLILSLTASRVVNQQHWAIVIDSQAFLYGRWVNIYKGVLYLWASANGGADDRCKYAQIQKNIYIQIHIDIGIYLYIPLYHWRWRCSRCCCCFGVNYCFYCCCCCFCCRCYMPLVIKRCMPLGAYSEHGQSTLIYFCARRGGFGISGLDSRLSKHGLIENSLRAAVVINFFRLKAAYVYMYVYAA